MSNRSMYTRTNEVCSRIDTHAANDEYNKVVEMLDYVYHDMMYSSGLIDGRTSSFIITVENTTEEELAEVLVYKECIRKVLQYIDKYMIEVSARCSITLMRFERALEIRQRTVMGHLIDLEEARKNK